MIIFLTLVAIIIYIVFRISEKEQKANEEEFRDKEILRGMINSKTLEIERLTSYLINEYEKVKEYWTNEEIIKVDEQMKDILLKQGIIEDEKLLMIIIMTKGTNTQLKDIHSKLERHRLKVMSLAMKIQKTKEIHYI